MSSGWKVSGSGLGLEASCILIRQAAQYLFSLVVSHVRVSACTEGLTEGALIGISVEVVPFGLPSFVLTHRADEGCSFSDAHVADRLGCSGLCIVCLEICGCWQVEERR